ncbi:hypothetical protein OS190_08680 [Sulfitobacter sp. F26204]|uniref:hypothetical protein n=1 Tax=Sulfitobacter sp. F26204 TaxID=2996014 RepID=UPI00225E39A7|nr:hypothetical protein [Sulfitobacter sp. F26204]MCX7559643.1 hypothetical protein [Sulfitobacter sp. F26204]
MQIWQYVTIPMGLALIFGLLAVAGRSLIAGGEQMPPNITPCADRLPGSQRIDACISNPGWHGCTQMDSRIMGELVLNCPGAEFRRCLASAGAYARTVSHNYPSMAEVRDADFHETETLSGLKVQGEGKNSTGKTQGISDIHPHSRYWMGTEIIAARGVKRRGRNNGRVWGSGGMSVEIGLIDGQGTRP